MRCPDTPCDNKDGYCRQDPPSLGNLLQLRTHHLKRLVDLVKKGLLELETHDDILNEVRVRDLSIG